MTTPSQRRRSDAEMVFQGVPLGPDLLPSIWRIGTIEKRRSRFRINTARGLRLKTTVVELAPTWARKHPEASEWVVKVLPERRTLERDLIATVASTEPVYSRQATGFLDRDKDNAEAFENYMEEWRQEYVPYQTFAEKAAEDGEFGVVVMPTDMDMEGAPDFYDRCDQAAYDLMDEEAQQQYALDEHDPKGRYAKAGKDGAKQTNPAYARDKSGKPVPKGGTPDDAASRDAHKLAVQRYLLKQEQGGVSIRVIPALDCVPFLTRGTKRDRWKLHALVERTLYYPEELIAQGYGWRGMGDRLLVPRGFDPTRDTGQNGMFYLYTLYMVWVDPKDPKRKQRPIVAYSVSGHPTWRAEPEPDDKKLPDSGVAVLDLYESYGLEGAFWWYGGGLHTSDDDADYYWEPYLWPLSETILGIEGMQTSVNATVVANAFTGYLHTPDAGLVGQGGVDDEALVEADGRTLRKPIIPEAGEIETAVGTIAPFNSAQLSPDVWRVIQAEYDSLRANTTLEHAGAADQASGRQMVVKETIAQTAKRHIREGAADAVKFCGEKAARIFNAIALEHGYRWPIQTTRERPIGSETRTAGDILEWNPDWVGDGEYKLATDYPQEYDPVRVETAAAMADRGYGSPEDVWEAEGKTDAENEWARILKWRIRQNPAYIETQVTRLAKLQGNRLMLQVLKLQNDQKMTKQGPPGFEKGVPNSALNGPGASTSGGINGGPTTAQRSIGGQMAAVTGPAQQDAALAAQVPGQGAAA